MTTKLVCPCHEIAVTPEVDDYLFGFNDICPWNPDDTMVAALRVPGALDRLANAEPAELCLWRSDDDAVTPIAVTRAWNYQQGARQRWLADGSLLFNDTRDGAAVTVRLSAGGAEKRCYSRAIHALSPDEAIGVGPSYGRNAVHYPGYGYPAAADAVPSVGDPHPSDDGVWALDMVSGRETLLVSLDDLARESGLPPHMTHFVTHFWFNPGGSEFLFVHGANTADGGVFGRLMVCGRDGGSLRVAASEMVSHPCWIDDHAIAVWTRNAPAMAALRRNPLFRLPAARAAARLFRRWQGIARNRLLAEGLTRIDTRALGRKQVLAPAAITENGHWSRHPRVPVLVGDTYPDAAGQLHLYLYDLASDTKVAIASFDHGVRWPSAYLRSDLHPRWDRSGRRIAVDISRAGTRRVAVVDAAPALIALGYPVA